MLDEDHRGAGEIGKEARLAETADEGEPEEAPSFRRRPIGGEGLPQTPAFFARLMGFRQEEDHDGEARRGRWPLSPRRSRAS